MKRRNRIILSIAILIAFITTSVGLTTIAVNSIKLNTSSVKIQVGRTYKLNITFTPENATNKKLTFSSANKKIAIVDKNGIIKGIIPGKTVITVTSSSNKKALAKCNVTIIRNNLVRMTIAGSRGIGVTDNSWMQKEMEKKFNVKLTLERLPSGADGNTRMGVLIASGKIPDVMQGVDWRSLQNQGVLGEVKPETIKKYAPNIYASLGKMEEASGLNVFDIWSVDGKFYGYPATSAYSYKPAYSRAWRVDLLKKAGINKVPDSIMEMENAFKEVKKVNPNVYGMSAGGRDLYWQFATDVYGAYCYSPDTFVYKDGKVISSFMMPEMKEALSTLARWYSLGYIDPEYLTDDNTTHSRKWLNGKLLSHAWDAGEQSTAQVTAQAIDPEAKIELGNNIVGPKGKSGMPAWLPYNGMIVFSKSMAENEDKMQRFFEIADKANYDEETYLWMSFGEKGLHYDFDTDEKVLWKKPYDVGAEREKQGIGSAGMFYWFFAYSGYNVDLVTKYQITKISAEFSKKWSSNPQNKVYFPVTLVNPIPQEIINVSLGDLWREYFDSVIMGRKKIADYDDFLKKWLDGGGQKYLDTLESINLKFFKNKK